MSWKRERDGLIAQTLAFVQSVTGKRDEFSGDEPLASEREARVRSSAGAEALMAVEMALGAAAPRPVSSAVSGDAPIVSRSPTPNPAQQTVEPQSVAPPSPTPIAPRPIAASEVANEIRARVASFRAHQERFNREREEYFAATLARLKAAIKDVPPPTRLGK
jgi:hypothetical protein